MSAKSAIHNSTASGASHCCSVSQSAIRKFPTLSPRLVILLRASCVEDHLNAIATAGPEFAADVEIIRQAVHQLRARCSATKLQP